MSITPPQTRQFQSFKNNLEYARNMIKAGDSLEGLQPSAVDIADLYRAAWVQAVSAVDHWLHEELFRRVEELAADPESKLPKQLSNFELPLSVIEAIRREERTTADAVLEHVQAKWAYLPLHNPRKISEAYRLVTDIDLWQTAAERMNEWSHNRTSYNAQKIKKRFSAIVERRNKIAHYADLEDGDLQRRRPITSGEATDALDWLERIVLAIAKGLD